MEKYSKTLKKKHYHLETHLQFRAGERIGHFKIKFQFYLVNSESGIKHFACAIHQWFM